MTVLGLVTYQIYPTRMGGQKGVALFYKYLSQHVNVVLALSRDNEVADDDTLFPVLFANRRLPLNIARYGVLKKLVCRHKPDVIIAEHSYAGWLAWLLRKHTGVPFVVHSHNIEAHRFREMGRWWWRAYGLYEKWIHRQANGSFFISRADQNFALTTYNLQPEKCAVVPYGVEETADLRNDRNVPKPNPWGFEKVMYFNGTLDYRPNIDALHVLLQHVLPQLQKTSCSVVLLVTGNRASPELMHVLNNTAHVQFRDYVRDVAKCYQQADVFVNPMQHPSGVKTKVIEALANHCPVVSTRAGAQGIEAAVCGSNLTIVNDGDWTAFTKAVIQVLKQPAAPTPRPFFETYQWKPIAATAAQTLQKIVHA